MSVKIGNKQYKMVVERLNEMKEDVKGKYDLTTKIVDAELNNGALIKATLVLERGKYTGHAYEKEGANFINEQSHIENCETSAIGRALASAGYAGNEFASAEEVANAKVQQKNKAAARKNNGGAKKTTRAKNKVTALDGMITVAQISMLEKLMVNELVTDDERGKVKSWMKTDSATEEKASTQIANIKKAIKEREEINRGEMINAGNG